MREETDDYVERLYEVVPSLRALLRRLGRLLPEQERSGPDTGTIGRSAPESSEPWARQAAGVYWDVWFGARTLLNKLRADLDLAPVELVGFEALSAIFNAAPAAPEASLRRVVRRLERYVERAQEIPDIDESEPWTPLPQTAGSAPPICPYCLTYSLRMLKRKGEVRCFYPGCHDSEGNPTRARMERGRLTGQGVLVFGDGTVMGGHDGQTQ